LHRGGAVLDDNEIIDLFWLRDEKAIAVTSEKYGAMCKGIAYNVLGNSSDAEECFNDALLKLWNSIPPARPHALSCYVSTVVRNSALDVYRKDRAEKRVPSELTVSLDELWDLPDNSDSDFFKEENNRLEEERLLEIINRFLGAQKSEFRKIFVCRYYYFDAVKDIAVRFKMSESKVKSVLFRLRNKLRKILEKEGLM
jgi:RNA polymerase sigma-70 factor (ECF subfamily)